MKQPLTLTAAEYAEVLDGKPFLITKLDCEVGDDLLITEQGTRNQVERRITHMQTDGVFKGAVCLGIAVPGTRLLAARGIPPDVDQLDAVFKKVLGPDTETLPAFSPAEKSEPYID